MKYNSLYKWLFSSLEEIIESEFICDGEEKDNEQDIGKRFIEISNDTGKSRGDNAK